MNEQKSEKKRSGGRRLLKIFAVVVVALVLLVVVGVVLAPTLAGPLVAGRIASAAEQSLNGDVRIGSVGLSWRGEQRIRGLRVIDDSGAQVTNLDVTLSRGLLELIGNPMKLGTITIGGEAAIDLDRIGTLATGGGGTGAAPPAGEVRLPRDLEAELVVDLASLSLAKNGQRATWTDVSGSITLDPGLVVDGTLSGMDEAGDEALALEVSARDLIDATGALTLPESDVLVMGDVDVPGPLASALMGLDPGGDTRGGAHLRINLRAKDGVVHVPPENRRPYLRIEMPGAVRAMLEERAPDLKLLEAPAVQLELYQIEVPVPELGRMPDLRFAPIRLRAEIGEAVARIRDPESDRVRELLIEPSDIAFVSENGMGQGIEMTGGGPLRLDGEYAGDYLVQGQLRRLLDSEGWLRGELPIVIAEAGLTTIPAEVVQPFVTDLGIDVSEFAGPSVSARVRVQNMESDEAPGAVIPIRADAFVTSEWFRVEADLSFSPEEENEISGRTLLVQAHRSTGLVRRFLPEDIEVEGDAVTLLRVADYSVPVEGDVRLPWEVTPDRIRLDRASADVRAAVGNITLRREGAEPLSIASLDHQLVLAPGEEPLFGFDYRGAEGQRPVRARGEFVLRNAAPPESAARLVEMDWRAVRPTGGGELQSMPSGVLAYASPEAARQLGAVFGETLEGRFELSTPEEGQSDAGTLAADLRLNGRGASLRANLAYDGERIETRGEGVTLTMDDPGAVARSLAGKTGEAEWAAEGPSSVAVRRLRVPLPGEGAYPLSDIEVDAEASDVPTALVRLVAPDDAPVIEKALGPLMSLRVRNGEAESGAVALVAEMTSRRAEASATISASGKTLTVDPARATVRATPGLMSEALARYAPDVEPRPALREGSPIEIETTRPILVSLVDGWRPDPATLRPFRVRARATEGLVIENVRGVEPDDRVNIGVRDMDVRLGYDHRNPLKRELVAEADVFDPALGAGSPVVASVRAMTDLAPGLKNLELLIEDLDCSRADAMLGRPGYLGTRLGGTADVSITAAPESTWDSLMLTSEVRSELMNFRAVIAHKEDLTRVVEPFTAQWTITPEVANEFARYASKAESSPVTEFLGPIELRAEVRELAFGSMDKPFDPEFFRCDVGLSAPAVRFTSAESGVYGYRNISAALRRGEARGRIDFEARGTPEQEGIEGIDITGRVEGLDADSRAQLVEQARVWLDARGHVPTFLLDAVTRSDVEWVALLGPAADVQVVAESFGRDAGTLRASFTSTNATGRVEGRIEGGRFVATTPASAEVRRVTQEVSADYLQALLPFLEQFEKTTEDRPATVNAEGLTVPLDGDLSKLNGRLSIDLGTVRFRATRLFSRFLKATKNNWFGTAGQNIKPFEMVIEKGVVTYQKVLIPTGEFTFETEGTIDLVNNTIDMYVFVPFYAVSGEVSSALQHIPGLGRVTPIPFRFRGPLDSPRVAVDPQKMVKRLPENLGNTIGEILGGVGDLIPRRREQNDDAGENNGKENTDEKDGGEPAPEDPGGG